MVSRDLHSVSCNLLAGLLIVVSATRSGLALADGRVQVDGVVKSSYEIGDRVGPEAEIEIEIEIESKRVEKTRAVVKIEGRYFREALFMEDGYLDHKVSKRLKFQLGINKKRLGMEYEQSSRARLTPNRSFIYQELEERGLVGRQLNFRRRYDEQLGEVADVAAVLPRAIDELSLYLGEAYASDPVLSRYELSLAAQLAAIREQILARAALLEDDREGDCCGG